MGFDLGGFGQGLDFGYPQLPRVSKWELRRHTRFLGNALFHAIAHDLHTLIPAPELCKSQSARSRPAT